MNQQEHNNKIYEDLKKNVGLIKDKEWRMSNLYWITTKSGTKELFKMNRAQKHFFENYLFRKQKDGSILLPYHRHIILKSRQLGYTTFIQLYMLDEILFNPNKEALVIAHKLEDSKEFFDRKIDYAVRNMDERVQSAFFKIDRNSARKLKILWDYGDNQNSTSTISVGVSGRSGSYNYVHISEFAKLGITFPERAAEVLAGTVPAVAFDGFIFIESTANGAAGSFFEMFNESWLEREKITPMVSRVKFLPHFYNWQYDDMEMEKITEIIDTKDMPVCEIPWKEYQKENNLTDKEITYYYMKFLQMGGVNGTDSYQRLRSEYPTTVNEAFISSGQAYFAGAKVAQMAQTACKGTRGEIIKDALGKYQFQEVSNGFLEIWKLPEQGKVYTIGGDSAEGLSWGDNQVLYVVENKSKDCVALYMSKVPPDEFAKDAFNVGKFYNNALLAIEANKDGLWINDSLDKLGYYNLYYRKTFDDITGKIQKYYGWKTTSSTRPYMLTALKTVFLQKNEGLPLQLLGEMLTFIRNEKGKPEALSGKNDDCVISASICMAVLQDNFQQEDIITKEAPSPSSIMFGEVPLPDNYIML